MNKITNFKIEKLHGYKTYDIEIKDNILILVGENGAGKTTVLRTLYYFLTCQWEELTKYNFDKIELTIDNESYKVSKSDLKDNLIIPEKYIHRIPPHLRQKFRSVIASGDISEIERFAMKYEIPLHNVYHQMNLFPDKEIIPSAKKIKEISDAIKNTLNLNILYLPMSSPHSLIQV